MNEVKVMFKRIKYAIVIIVCVVSFMSNSVQAKIIEPDLKSEEADYYIIEEATSKNLGKVSAKLQNRAEVIEIPETVVIKGREYIVTKVTGNCYPDTLDSSLKQDAYKCVKNKKTTKIVLPKTIKSIQKGAFTNFTRLRTIKIDHNNKKYKVVNGSVLSKNGKIFYGTITLRELIEFLRELKQLLVVHLHIAM